MAVISMTALFTEIWNTRHNLNLCPWQMQVLGKAVTLYTNRHADGTIPKKTFLATLVCAVGKPRVRAAIKALLMRTCDRRADAASPESTGMQPSAEGYAVGILRDRSGDDHVHTSCTKRPRCEPLASPSAFDRLDDDTVRMIFSHCDIPIVLKRISQRCDRLVDTPKATAGKLFTTRVPLIAWARDHGCPWNGRTCASAAKHGALQVLQFLHANRCPWDARTCAWAAMNNHLEVIQFAHARGCPWDANTCNMAAYNGNLEILKWARLHECPWDADIPTIAAFHGHLALLQWAYANKCYWDDDISIAAVINGQMHVIQWLHFEGFTNVRTCVIAALRGRLEVLQWLHAHGCPWNAHAFNAAVKKGHLEVVRWMHARGCPWDATTCAWAAASGHLEVLAWLDSKGCPWDAETLISVAPRYPDVLAWIHSH